MEANHRRRARCAPGFICAPSFHVKDDNLALKTALRYAADDVWYSFPALIIGKQKLSYVSKDDPDGSGLNWGATKDPALIARYYERFPRAGVGIPTGPINDIFV